MHISNYNHFKVLFQYIIGLILVVVRSSYSSCWDDRYSSFDNLVSIHVLQKRYREENRMAGVSGASLLSNIDFNEGGSSSEYDTATASVELKDIYKQAASISAAFHTLESTTRAAEKNLVDTYNLSKAATQFNAQKAR